MNEQRETVHVRLPKRMVKQIDHLAVDADMYRQGMFEKLLGEALEKYVVVLQQYARP